MPFDSLSASRMVQERIKLDQFLADLPDEKPYGGCARCGSGQAEVEAVGGGDGPENIYPTTGVRFGYMPRT